MGNTLVFDQMIYFLTGWKRKVLGGPPVYLTYFVTPACNASCIHCLNVGRPPADSVLLSPSEIEHIATSMKPFHNLLVSGGEPFLRSDLSELVEPFVRHCKVRQITIPTNGSFPDKIEQVTERLVARCPQTKVNIRIAIDGPPETHDQIRGIENGFELAMESAEKISLLSQSHPNLWLEFCFTMSTANETAYKDVLAEFDRRGIAQSPFILLCRPPTLQPDVWKISRDNYLAAHEAREKRVLRQPDAKPGSLRSLFSRVVLAYIRLTRKQILRVWDQPDFRWRCSAGALSLVMNETGTIYPCETTWEPLGHLRDLNYDMERILRGDRIHNFRKSIRKGCRCTHETNVTLDSSLTPLAAVTAVRYAISPPKHQPPQSPGASAQPVSIGENPDLDAIDIVDKSILRGKQVE